MNGFEIAAVIVAGLFGTALTIALLCAGLGLVLFAVAGRREWVVEDDSEDD